MVLRLEYIFLQELGLERMKDNCHKLFLWLIMVTFLFGWEVCGHRFDFKKSFHLRLTPNLGIIYNGEAFVSFCSYLQIDRWIYIITTIISTSLTMTVDVIRSLDQEGIIMQTPNQTLYRECINHKTQWILCKKIKFIYYLCLTILFLLTSLKNFI